MSRRIVTSAHVDEGGALHIHHQDSFERRIAEQFRDKRVRVTVEKETRNLRQNGLYWIWTTIVGQHFGYEPEDIHEINKSHCNRRTLTWVDRKTGEIHDDTTGASTADLSVDAFAEYMERVQRFWAEQGISLPTSEEGTWR